MAIVHTVQRAFGAPGIAPRWTQSTKDTIGTAYSAASTVWFTVAAGLRHKVDHPTIDPPVSSPFATALPAKPHSSPIRCTFFWPDADCWEGRDFVIDMEGTP